MGGWSSEIISLLGRNDEDTKIIFAKVNSVDRYYGELKGVSIEVSEQIISKHVYVTDSVERVEEGDDIIVVKAGVEFYVLGRIKK